MTCGVYVIENTANGHRYVGSTSDLRRRLAGHLLELRKGGHGNPYLQRAWAKYGEAAFEFRVLLLCPKRVLRRCEQAAINVMRPRYNIAPVARSWYGMHHTDASREAISMALTGVKLGPEHRAKLSAAAKERWARGDRPMPSMLGKKHTAEWKDAARQWLSGRPVSEETRQKIREIHLANREVFVAAGRKGGGRPKKK